MSSTLAPGQAIELVQTLKGTVQDIAARAAKLNEAARTRAARQRLRREAALKEEQVRLGETLAEAEVEFQNAKATSEINFQRRKDRIGKAYQSSKEQRLREIEDRTGKRKYELQKQVLQAERDRDSGLAANASARENFLASLTGEQQELLRLEAEARDWFRGYWRLTRALASAASTAPAPDLLRGQDLLFSDLRAALEGARSGVAKFKRYPLLRVFRYWLLWLLLGAVAFVPLPFQHPPEYTWQVAVALAGGLVALIVAIRFSSRGAYRAAKAAAASLGNARRLYEAAYNACETRFEQEQARIKNEYQATVHTVDQELKRALGDASQQRVACRMKADEKTVRITAKWEQLYKARVQRREEEHPRNLDRLRQESEARTAGLLKSFEEQDKALQGEVNAQWRALESEWKSKLEPILTTVTAGNAAAEALFPPWDGRFSETWSPPAAFAGAARLGWLKVEPEELCQVPLPEGHFTEPQFGNLALTLALKFPQQGSVLLETAEAGREEAVGALNNIVLRLLTTSPPGRVNFTVLDPVALGQNFAGLMHMADYEEQIISSKIWTQSGQIEQKLAELNEHIEKVIQMYLRNEYATIAEYNEQAGVIAEKYHFLVVADFPAGFTDVAAKRLMSIATSGAKCGVYTLIHWDKRQPLPDEFIPEELRKNSFCLSAKNGEWLVNGAPLPGTQVSLEQPPSAELATQFVHRIGMSSRDSSRVEVPFTHVLPPEDGFWKEDTSNELRVPIGRTGATKLQYLAIGKGTRQHGLIAGKTGSGKSTLFHVMITNLSLWCNPEQVEFYLVDFKKGVEFKCYATHRLPHARVVAIESDREFGLSVLMRVDEELKRRGDLFRQLGVQDLAGYKREGGIESLPRSLLMIDEFQEFFVEDDRIAQTASLLLDRIVRQGRAFGIHVLLGSQTLGGAYTVARTTLGQMVIRIALQCNEADAYLIMDESNPAPRLLSRPGEGIYNDAAGALAANSPFQVVWLSDTEREVYLEKTRTLAQESGRSYSGPIVFEGNAPADIRENELLRQLLETGPTPRAAAPRIWLGAPNSIKGPTEAVFYRQSGSNLLIVGQREDAVLAMISTGLVALAAQHPPGTARFILFDGTPPGSSHRAYIERLAEALGDQLTLARQGELASIMAELGAEMKKRSEDTDPDQAPAVFLVINGLQRYGKLRYEEDFSFSGSSDTESERAPAAVLNELICEGTRLGFHVIASCDTYNNVMRFLSRKAFSEFEMRLLFQMSANDSASLIDNPKASTLGLYRALFFNQHEGYLETFRPYALPGPEWLAQAARQQLRSALKPQV